MAGVSYERAVWNNGYHRPDDDSGVPEAMGALRRGFGEMIEDLYAYCPPSRERSEALTLLESSRMWAIMSLAVNTEDAPA